nr:unnamed protein product [Digitaria exilis]CAB3502544.1 unnamed protein product [Digitaria exilis]
MIPPTPSPHCCAVTLGARSPTRELRLHTMNAPSPPPRPTFIVPPPPTSTAPPPNLLRVLRRRRLPLHRRIRPMHHRRINPLLCPHSPSPPPTTSKALAATCSEW